MMLDPMIMNVSLQNDVPMSPGRWMPESDWLRVRAVLDAARGCVERNDEIGGLVDAIAALDRDGDAPPAAALPPPSPA